MRKLSLLLVAVIMVLMSVAPALAQDEGNIVDVAVANEELFSTLVAAVQAADPAILETLTGPGPYTVFAPTNQAFSNLFDFLGVTPEELLANTELLTTVLLYHVVEGEVLAEQVIGLDGQSVPTLLGEGGITITIQDGNVILNDVVQVTSTDIQASNGVIHVIDDVLLPQSVLDSLSAEPDQEEEMMAADEFVNIRVAHFSPDTPAVDVYVNGEAAITNLAFPDVTDFITLPAGTYEIAVAPAGTSIDQAAIGPADFDLPAGEFVTVAAIGSLNAGTLAPSIFIKDFSPIPEGSARVVVFHGIEDAPAVDVRAGGTVLINGLAYPGSFITADGTPNDGAFELDVPAGTYDLTVTPAGATTPVVLDLSGTTLEAGVYYLVAAVGTLENPSVSLKAVDATTASELRAAIGEEDMMTTEGTIVDIAVADGRFETLVTAVIAADLAETLAGEGPFTVFAPTDDAFAALPEGTVESLLNNIPALTDILLYHVVSGEVLAETVVTLDAATTLQGSDVTISVQDGNVFLNDTIQVIITDIEATNGVIHVIDGVLLPPQ